MRESVNGVVLEVRDLVKDYVTRDARLKKRVTRAVDRRQLRGSGARDVRHRWRVWVGQVDDRARDSELDRRNRWRGASVRCEHFELKEREFRKHRQDIQIVFQDPLAAFDPKSTIRASLREYAEVRAGGRRSVQDAAIDEAIRDLGLDPAIAARKPAQVSGGQLQRLSVARSLLVDPRLVFLDEPTSSLDVSIRGQIVNLLLDRQQRDELSFLLVAHDLQVVYAMATRVAVMYLGQFVEVGTRDQVYEHAQHPYTRGLLDAAGLKKPQRIGDPVRLTGELSEEHKVGVGCRLTLRCPFAEPRCDEPQSLRATEDGHLVRCWKAVEQPVSIGLPGRAATPQEHTS